MTWEILHAIMTMPLDELKYRLEVTHWFVDRNNDEVRGSADAIAMARPEDKAALTIARSPEEETALTKALKNCVKVARQRSSTRRSKTLLPKANGHITA